MRKAIKDAVRNKTGDLARANARLEEYKPYITLIVNGETVLELETNEEYIVKEARKCMKDYYGSLEDLLVGHHNLEGEALEAAKAEFDNNYLEAFNRYTDQYEDVYTYGVIREAEDIISSTDTYLELIEERVRKAIAGTNISVEEIDGSFLTDYIEYGNVITS